MCARLSELCPFTCRFCMKLLPVCGIGIMPNYVFEFYSYMWLFVTWYYVIRSEQLLSNLLKKLEVWVTLCWCRGTASSAIRWINVRLWRCVERDSVPCSWWNRRTCGHGRQSGQEKTEEGQEGSRSRQSQTWGGNGKHSSYVNLLATSYIYDYSSQEASCWPLFVLARLTFTVSSSLTITKTVTKI